LPVLGRIEGALPKKVMLAQIDQLAIKQARVELKRAGTQPAPSI